MAEQGFLFAEMQLQTRDVIDCKGKRLYTSGIYRLWGKRLWKLFIFCNSRKFQEIGKTGVNYIWERIIRSRIEGSYKDKPVVEFNEVMELGRMTREEIEQKTSLCFLLNPNIPEEEKICVIEKVMATKATIVSKAALCNIITYILKQNAKLKSKNCTQAGRLWTARTNKNWKKTAIYCHYGAQFCK